MENKRINWYPGHMFKAKKEIQNSIKSIDAVIEVVDSRLPIVGHNEMLEEIVKSKPKLIVFSKKDLVQGHELERFIDHYKSKGFETIALDVHKNNTDQKVIKKIELICEPIFQKYEKKGIHKTLRVLVIGMPNVGKSTLINAITKKKKTVVGNKPGVTKSQQVVKIQDNIELVDTPGILIPKIEKLEDGFNLVLNTLIKDDVVELEEVAFYLLKYLVRYKIELLKKRYPKLSEVDDYDIIDNVVAVEAIYEAIAKSIGVYSKHSGTDYSKVSIRLINDYRQQKFGKIILDEIR